MLQVYINSTVLDCYPNVLEQFAFDYQAFPLYDFATVTNGFAGNITFPPTKTNKNVFGKVDISNLDTGVTRSYPALIQYSGITFFKGTAYLESYSSGGYELRFETDTQFIFDSLKDATMWEVLKNLGLRTDSNDLFDTAFTHDAVWGYLSGVKSSTLFPLIDNGLFKNSERYVNFFDLRPAFKLEPLVKYIAEYVGRTLTINDTERLDSLFLTPDVFEYGEQFREANRLLLGTTTTFDTYANRVLNGPTIFTSLGRIFGYYEDLEQAGKFTYTRLDTRTPISGVYRIQVESDYRFNTTAKVNFRQTVRITNLIYQGEVRPQYVQLKFAVLGSFSLVENGTAILVDGWNSGYSSARPLGRTPEVEFVVNDFGDTFILFKVWANQATYSPYGTTDAYLTFDVSFQIPTTDLEVGDLLELYAPLPVWKSEYQNGEDGQGLVTVSCKYDKIENLPFLEVTHDEVILPNGFISAADLLSNLKANDVLKFALRQVGGILTDTGTQLIITTLDQLTRADAKDWTTKLVNINEATVDFIEDNLGLNNYLLFPPNDNNGNIDEYYQALNLPSTGRGNVNLYVAPTDQTINSQAFQGNLTLPLIQFFKIAYNTLYNAYSTSLTYQPNELVGYNGEVYKVITAVDGGDGLPDTLPSDYELVERSLLGEQDAGNRCIWVEAIEFPADNNAYLVNTNGTDSGLFVQWKGNTELAGFENAEPLYGFLPDTFLDYRTFSVMLNLTLLDILQLDLNRLVFIKQLNGYFYVNKIENYTPAPNILTKVLLTRIK
jgi:hypothetical protein